MKQFSGEYKQLVVDMLNAEDLSKHGMVFNGENSSERCEIFSTAIFKF